MTVMDLWYFAIDSEMLIGTIEQEAGIRRRAIKRLAKARESSTSEGIFPKLVDDSGGLPIHQRATPGDLPLERSRSWRGPPGHEGRFRPVS